MLKLKNILVSTAMALSLGLGSAATHAVSVKQGPFACPVNTALTAGKLAATCNTYGFYNPEDNPQTDDLTKVQGLYPVITTFYGKDEGGDDSGAGDGNFFLTDDAFAPVDYGNTLSGYFLISNSLLSSYNTFVLVLKGADDAPRWVAFEFLASNLITGTGDQTGFSYGTWKSGTQGLSHASLYVGDGDRDLPEPGSLALLGLGLMGLGFSRRRKSV